MHRRKRKNKQDAAYREPTTLGGMVREGFSEEETYTRTGKGGAGTGEAMGGVGCCTPVSKAGLSHRTDVCTVFV